MFSKDPPTERLRCPVFVNLLTEIGISNAMQTRCKTGARGLTLPLERPAHVQHEENLLLLIVGEFLLILALIIAAKDVDDLVHFVLWSSSQLENC